MHQNAPFIPLNIKNRLPKQGGIPLLQTPPSRPAAARVGDALSAYSCKISFYSQTYLHPCVTLVGFKIFKQLMRRVSKLIFTVYNAGYFISCQNI